MTLNDSVLSTLRNELESAPIFFDSTDPFAVELSLSLAKLIDGLAYKANEVVEVKHCISWIKIHRKKVINREFPQCFNNSQTIIYVGSLQRKTFKSILSTILSIPFQTKIVFVKSSGSKRFIDKVTKKLPFKKIHYINPKYQTVNNGNVFTAEELIYFAYCSTKMASF